MTGGGESFNWLLSLAAAQHADEKPVGIGAARRHQQAGIRHQHDAAEQKAAFAERIRDLDGRHDRELRTTAREAAYLRAVLVVEHRAGDVGDATTRLYQC